MYTDGTRRLELQIWELADSAKTKAVYDAMMTNSSFLEYPPPTWTDVAGIGEAARVANDNTLAWWFGARKGAYYFAGYTKMANPTVALDQAAKDAGEAFMKVVASKLP